MEHKISIWSKNKETGKGFIIETHVKITQEQIQEFALNEFLENCSIDEDKEYFAELDETIHS